MDFSLVIIIIIPELAFSGYGREARYPAFATFSRPQKTVCGILMLDFWYPCSSWWSCGEALDAAAIMLSGLPFAICDLELHLCYDQACLSGHTPK